jgi:CP family cyanate transporter-like MFS transporter
MWSSAVAWQVTAVMGTQATTFYLLVTWLPTIEISHGVAPVAAGWHLFLYQVVGVGGGLLVTVFMRGRTDHRLVGAGVTLTMLIGVLGLLLVPSLSRLWIVVAGLSGGSSLVVALALVGERSRTAADAAKLSGMVQSVGYLLAVAGPIGAGVLFELTGSWTWPLVGVLGVGLVQLVVVWLAGRDRFV